MDLGKQAYSLDSAWDTVELGIRLAFDRASHERRDSVGNLVAALDPSRSVAGPEE